MAANSPKPVSAWPSDRADKFTAPPAVASLSRFWPVQGPEKGMEELADRLSGVMRATADLAESAGGLVGHVKAVIDLGGRGGAALSLVRREVRVKPLPGAGERPPEAAKISLTAIVYGLSANHLQNFLTQRLDLAFPPLYPAFLK